MGVSRAPPSSFKLRLVGILDRITAYSWVGGMPRRQSMARVRIVLSPLVIPSYCTYYFHFFLKIKYIVLPCHFLEIFPYGLEEHNGKESYYKYITMDYTTRIDINCIFQRKLSFVVHFICIYIINKFKDATQKIKFSPTIRDRNTRLSIIWFVKNVLCQYTGRSI